MALFLPVKGCVQDPGLPFDRKILLAGYEGNGLYVVMMRLGRFHAALIYAGGEAPIFFFCTAAVELNPCRSGSNLAGPVPRAKYRTGCSSAAVGRKEDWGDYVTSLDRSFLSKPFLTVPGEVTKRHSPRILFRDNSSLSETYFCLFLPVVIYTRRLIDFSNDLHTNPRCTLASEPHGCSPDYTITTASRQPASQTDRKQTGDNRDRLSLASETLPHGLHSAKPALLDRAIKLLIIDEPTPCAYLLPAGGSSQIHHLSRHDIASCAPPSRKPRHASAREGVVGGMLNYRVLGGAAPADGHALQGGLICQSASPKLRGPS